MSNTERPNAKENSPDNPKSWGQAGDLARGDPEAKVDFNGREGGGDSGGGAYPNPHSGKEEKKGGDQGGYMGHGGQAEMPYHGSGQLGEDVVGDNANAPATKAKHGDNDDHSDG